MIYHQRRIYFDMEDVRALLVDELLRLGVSVPSAINLISIRADNEGIGIELRFEEPTPSGGGADE